MKRANNITIGVRTRSRKAAMNSGEGMSDSVSGVRWNLQHISGWMALGDLVDGAGHADREIRRDFDADLIRRAS